MNTGDQATTGTVLYVEDEQDDSFFMQLAFAQAGIGSSLRVVGDGKDALDYLEGRGSYADRARYPFPAVMLLDLNLPKISGFEVLARMRREPAFKTLPVVVFSSSSLQADRRTARALGATDYVEKPASPLEFGSVVQLLQERWLGATEPGTKP